MASPDASLQPSQPALPDNKYMNQYDSFMAAIYDGYFTGVTGDTRFYVEEALRTGGPVLELGCGTGRITIAIAEAGLQVTGLDISPEMLAIASRKQADLDSTIRARTRLVAGDMRNYPLKKRYKLICIPYRSFMHLMSPQEQVETLLNVRRHLVADGKLAFNIYDPSRELSVESDNGASLQYDTTFTHPLSGRKIVAWYTRQIDVINQLIHQRMRFDELEPDGKVAATYYGTLMLRYSHRYEIHYLLELCGFEVLDLFGGFDRSPFIGSEQIWLARSA